MRDIGQQSCEYATFAAVSCPNPRLVQETTLLSIIIISRNQIETIDRCLTSVQVATKAAGLDRYEVVFVDSKSTDGTPERVRERLGKDVTIVRLVDRKSVV